MDEESILLNIEFNSADIQKSIASISTARESIDKLLAANKALADQGQKNSAAYVKNQESIKALNSEVSSNSKIVQANTQAVKANADSIESLKAANKQLLIDRNKLSTSTAEGRAEIEKLNAKYDANSKVIAENSTQVEKQRFNIGNYQSALSGVSPELGKLSSGLTTVVSGLKSSEGGFKGAASAAGGMLKAALPIAALVAIFKILQTYITGSAAGMDLLEDVTASVKVVFEVLTDRVTKLIGGIGKLLSGDILGGLKEMGNSFSGIGDEIEREIDLTLELNSAIRDLEDREIAYDIAASKTGNTIKELLLQAKNRTLSEKQRIALLEKASALEKTQNQDLVKNRQDALQIVNDDLNKRIELIRLSGESEEEFGQRLIANVKTTDDQKKVVADAIIAFNGALGESITIQEKIQNQTDALAEKAEADAEKRAEKAQAAAEKAAEAEKKRLEDITAKQAELDERNLKAGNDLEIFRLEAAAKEIENVQERSDKLVEIEQTKAAQLLANAELTEAERQLIIEESEAAVNDIIAKGHEDQRSQDQERLKLALEDYKLYVEGLINTEKEKLLAGLISQEEYDEQLSDLQIAALEVQQAIKEDFGERDIALSGRITDAKIAQKQFEADQTAALEKRKVDAVQSTLGQVAGLFNKNSIAFKALATAQTLIQTYQSAQAVFTGMTTTIPGPVGIALGIAGAAAAIISGLANVAKINSTKVPKLAEGGVIHVGGRRHSQGGEDVHVGGKLVANVERGENMVVLKRGTSPLLRDLSNINMLAGGRNFYSDQSTRFHNADGGFVARAAGSQVSSFQNLSIAEDLKKVKIFTSITDLDRVRGQVNRANFTSELS